MIALLLLLWQPDWWARKAEVIVLKKEMLHHKQRYIELGVLSVKEDGRYFTHHYYIEEDLAIMENRLAQYNADWPREEDGYYRFPSLQECQQKYSEMNAYIMRLESHLPFLDPVNASAWNRIIADAESRRVIWTLIYDYVGCYGRDGPRLLLYKIKKAVGEKAFNNADWPPHLPPSGYCDNWPPLVEIPE
jgi:hypothetical protein